MYIDKNTKPIPCLSQSEFLDELNDAGDRLVVVEFTAVWCPKHAEVTSKIQVTEID